MVGRRRMICVGMVQLLIAVIVISKECNEARDIEMS
jgi:hypothetical protein